MARRRLSRLPRRIEALRTWIPRRRLSFLLRRRIVLRHKRRGPRRRHRQARFTWETRHRVRVPSSEQGLTRDPEMSLGLANLKEKNVVNNAGPRCVVCNYVTSRCRSLNAGITVGTRLMSHRS